MVPKPEGYPLSDRAHTAAWLAREGLRDIDERMAQAVRALVTRQFPRARRIAVLAGQGGNGRQAQAVARWYRETGLAVSLVRPGERGDPALAQSDVIVDGLIGAGLHGPLADPYRVLTEAAAASGRPVVAIDGPTGLGLDTGEAREGSLRATHTIACGVRAIGLMTGAGREYSGQVHVAEIGRAMERDSAAAWALGFGDLAALRPARRQDAHKGSVGTLAIAGGGPGMPGALRLGAEAALRAGAGLVIGLTHASHAPALAAAFPELIAVPALESPASLARARWLIVGSGLGRETFAQRVWQVAGACEKPLLVDGDGLYWLARAPERRPDWILTPHEGEAARLLGVSAAAIAGDRPSAVVRLQERYGGVCVLKGAGTLIADGDGLWLCPFGNAAMATAGMGDALAGIIGALAVQGLEASAAARLGVCVHALAGDRARASRGARGLLASDVIAEVPAVLETLC